MTTEKDDTDVLAVFAMFNELEEDSKARPREQTSPILAAGGWQSNAQLIEDVSRLYFREKDLVVDITYGRGKFWTDFEPPGLVKHDIRGDGVCWSKLPEESESVDVVVMDPPYVAMGGRKTSNLKGMLDEYGMTTTQSWNAREVHDAAVPGMAEAFRVLKPGGLFWYKCQDYISNHRYQPASHWAVTDCLAMGFIVEDRFDLVLAPRPQPFGRNQEHARRNISHLLVFRKPTKKRKS